MSDDQMKGTSAMKTLCSLLSALLVLDNGMLSAVETAASPIAAVHEWGTMTSVSGSDGRQVNWWETRLQGPAELPEFVCMNPRFAKGIASFVTRMETPVLCFYAEKPATTKVQVRFEGGSLTESFPKTLSFGTDTKTGATYDWTMDLLPPDSREKELVPQVGKRGAHYAHAREVPDAWLVRRKLAEPELAQAKKDGTQGKDEVEKFLFSRGAGDRDTPLRVSRPSETHIHLTASDPPYAYPDVWMVRVEGGHAAWKKVPALEASASFPNNPVEADAELPALPATDSPSNLAAVANELEGSFLPVLAKAGLSAAEAAAMVHTWRDTWFNEGGTRVLYVLPRGWVDHVLPLTIIPPPRKTKRVFVARLEVLSPSVEQTLLKVLNEAPDKADAAARLRTLKQLGLGRFLGAGMERAKQMHQQQAVERASRP